MKKTKEAFSLIVAIWLVMVSILLAILIVEYMIPFSRNIRWVENATASYYLAYTWIENGLYFFNSRTGKEEMNDISYSTWAISTKWYNYKTYSSWIKIPADWTWDSSFDSNWNTISMGDPIQLSVWYGFLKDLSKLWISFRVPDLNKNWLNDEKLESKVKKKADDTDIIISWQISIDTSDNTETLSALPDEMIKISDINSFKEIFLWNKNWRKIDSTDPILASSFFSTCWDSSKCILRFSVVNPLVQEGTWENIPFLEWQIHTEREIPLRYSIIESTGNTYWFSRVLNARYPQSTIPESLDFAIFQ